MIEIKLGIDEINKGIKNLHKTEDIIKKEIKKNKTKIPEPSFLAIITGGNVAYTKDGVKIIPVGCLK